MPESIVEKGPPEWSYAPADTSEPILDTTVGSVLVDVAGKYPDRMALIEGVSDSADRKTWTYAELLGDSQTLARALAQCFDKGERVAVWAPNIPE